MLLWEEFKNKKFGKAKSICSGVINVLAFLISIYSCFKEKPDLPWTIIICIIIFHSLYLIVVTIYEVRLYNEGSDIEKRILADKDLELENKNTKIALLENKIAANIDLAGKLRYYFKHIIITLNQAESHLLAVNSNYKEETDKIQELSSISADDSIENKISPLIANAENRYRHNMLHEFNSFLKDITTELKSVLDTSIREKGFTFETSISIKQFSRIVTDIKDINDVTIITTYRDSQTFSKGKREVGNREYSIMKNSDFTYCLTHRYFLKNNIQEDDRTYDNENKSFLDFYNCAIVVPIKCNYPDCDQMYGYLTCDILNTNYENTNILDDNMATIMEATATIIGSYFDSIDFQWDYVLETDVLDIIYYMKLNLK